MPYRLYEVDAPPLTRGALIEPEGEAFFFEIAERVLHTEAAAQNADFMPLIPNQLKVTPYLMDGIVRYVLDSSVELAEAGRCQVRQHVVETAWTHVGIREVLGIKDSDSGNMLEPFDQIYQAALAMINAGYAMEVLHDDSTEL